MKKIIRPTYPKEFSIGLLLLIFVIAAFLSPQIFIVPVHDLKQNTDVFVGMFLASFAVIIMVLILWEEILFPIKLKPLQGGGVVFKNRKSKLRMQMLMYASIPLIFGFIYIKYDINYFRFIMWTLVCMVPPVVGKILSGLNNVNDFLKLTDDHIEYKNNEQEGNFKVKDIQNIILKTDEDDILNKIELLMINNNSVIIDLDEMELEAFIDYIDKFIYEHYQHLLVK